MSRFRDPLDGPPVFGPTVSRPMLDDFSLRAQRMREKAQPAGIEPVYPLHMRNHPQWSGNNELGLELPFAPDANNRQTVLKLEEWGHPEIWTLCLGLNDFTDTAPALVFSVTALIQFGSGGVVQEVEIDWLNGTAISLPMNALSVTAQYNFASGEGDTVAPPDLRLRASLVRGTLNQALPTRTIFTPEGATRVRIPPFSKRLHFVSNEFDPFDTYSADERIDITANAFGTRVSRLQMSQFVSFIDIANQQLGSPQFVPLPARGLFVRRFDPVAGDYIEFISGTPLMFEIGV